MTIIRVKYAKRLPRLTPPLWFKFHGSAGDTPEGREKFARAYKMLVEFVLDHHSQRDVGAMHGLSGMRAAQLMRKAAYTWARSQGIDLAHDKTVPFKNDSKLVRNLYAGLQFIGEQQFDVLHVDSQKRKQ